MHLYKVPNRTEVQRVADSHVEAAWALDVHEEGVGRLHEPLELVLPLLLIRDGVKHV